MAKGVICDLDGLLVDSEPYQFAAFQDVLSPYGICLTQETFDWVGRRASVVIEHVLKEHDINANAHDLAHQRNLIFEELIHGNIRPIPGAVEKIAELSYRYSLAIATASIRAYADMLLSAIGVQQYFRAFSTGDLKLRGKPEPDLFHDAARKLALHPSSCVVLGDAWVDIEGASRAGMPSIAVPNVYTRKHDFSKATKVIGSLADLTIADIERL